MRQGRADRRAGRERAHGDREPVACDARRTGATGASAPSDAACHGWRRRSIPSRTPAGRAAELTAGQPAPDFTTSDQNGKAAHLADLKGESGSSCTSIQKDETPGCTHEACSFRDSWNEPSEEGRRDHRRVARHAGFAQGVRRAPQAAVRPRERHRRRHRREVRRAWCKRATIESRQSFVVSPDGKVKKVYRTVDGKVHAAEILADTSS